jgi:hypothetical protein
MWPSVIAIGLALNLGVVLFSLWCVLVGPIPGVLLGFVGFLVAAGGMTYTSRLGSWPGFFPASSLLWPVRQLLRGLGYLSAAGVGLGLIVTIASARCDGVGEGLDQPIFEPREVYRLNNHGKKTEVSRLRFLLVGSGFWVAWHSFSLGISSASLLCLLFGERYGWAAERGRRR